MLQSKTPGHVVAVDALSGNLVSQVGEQCIASASVNLNVTTKTTLYTVPAGFKLVVSKLVLRGASTSLTTASFGFGFDANATDVDGSTTHTELTASTLYSTIVVLSGAKIGVAADVFGVKCSIAQGAPATLTVDVYGTLIPV